MQPEIAHFVDEISALLSATGQLSVIDGEPKLKLILHVGTPKTGTTSLQTYLDKKQRKLRGKGILYPHNLDKLQNHAAPKHQWFEKNLVTTNMNSFLENFKNIIAQVKDDTHTIILSSEGIYNYWWDFPVASKQVLKELSSLFHIEVWVWFREPVGFIESYYKQCIRNPQVESNPCYGKNLSLAEMLNIDWFSKHLDYPGFIAQCHQLFGEGNVFAFEYNGDVVQEVIQKWGLATPHDNPTPRKNMSLHSASIEVLRTINQLNLQAKDKERVIPHLKEINDVLAPYAKNTLIDEASRAQILALEQAFRLGHKS